MPLATVDAVRRRFRAEALSRGVNPRDVDVLIADLTGKSVAYLVAHGELEIDSAPLQALLERRHAGEPLQYIRHRADFYGREFYVDDRVLIPRPETELLVEAAVKLAPQGARVIDIGSGSGAIAVSVKLERPDLHVTAADASLAALAVTALNGRGLGAAIGLAASDLLSAIDGRFDLILSNPPYIPAHEIEELQVEVRKHEPRMALTPGEQGTEMIDRLLLQAPAQLSRGGHVMLEIGFGQQERVRAIAASHAFTVDDIIADLAGIPRTVVLSKHG
jgi:release factor glutamine methyltransferase